MKQIEIFRSGSHTASSGAAANFSEQDLQRSIDAYDPALHEAPIVVGHPKDNHPAYGWVSGLSLSAGSMMAEVTQIDASFAEMVQAGRFKKRSASFYTPDAPTNPVPGTYYLRHVGFLGAQPPAVKGLRDVQFAEDDGVVEFAEDVIAISIVARVMRSLRDSLLAKWGADETEKALPGFMVEDLEAAARQLRDATDVAAPAMFTELEPEESNNEGDEMTAEQKAELDGLRVKTLELEAQVQEFAEGKAAAARMAKAAALTIDLAQLVSAGKVLPAEVAALTEFMAGLDDGADVVQFGESKNSLSYFKAMLAARPVAVDFTERAGAVKGIAEGLSAAQVAEKAQEYVATRRAGGHMCSFSEGVSAVMAGTAGE